MNRRSRPKPPAEPVAEQADKPDKPGKPPTGVKTMAVFKVKATSSLPIASAVWKVDIGEDPKEALIYTNLAYDLIAVAMGKLGIAMSEHILGDDAKMNKLAEEAASGRVE